MNAKVDIEQTDNIETSRCRLSQVGYVWFLEQDIIERRVGRSDFNTNGN